MFSVTVAREGKEKERGSMCLPEALWLWRGHSCPSGCRDKLLPASSCLPFTTSCPACPLVTCVGPHALPAWGFADFGLTGWLSGGCTISVSDSSCHLCRGLPGGGTAETDASQSMDNKSGRQGGGRRASLGVLGSWAGLALLLLPPCCSSCCCQAQESLQSATGRDKRERKRDVKAQEELEGKFSSLPASLSLLWV